MPEIIDVRNRIAFPMGNPAPVSAFFAFLIGLALCLSTRAGEVVTVNGTEAEFPTTIESKVGEKPVKLKLTGAALRKRFIFNVYAIGSYVQEGTPVVSAEALAELKVAKQLHLVIERDLDGKEMANGFKEGILRNYTEDAFPKELGALLEFMQATSVKKGTHVWLTHVPGVGLHCKLAGKNEILVKNEQVAHAVWNIYLGKNNLGVNIKKALISRW